MQIRKAGFAGSWYPRKAKACEDQIRQFLTAPEPCAHTGHTWIAGVVPHAGWYYSGEIACRVINCLRSAEHLDLVVVFGMHLHPSSPIHMMPEGAWETPFGDLTVDNELADFLRQRFRFVLETPERHMPDNTVELQLPFIKNLLNPEKFLALGVPPAPGSLEIAGAVAQWSQANGKRIRIIGSTDLTHYGGNYGFSPHGSGLSAVKWAQENNDRRVIAAMLAMNPRKVIDEGLENQSACCAGAVAAAVETAKLLGAVRACQVGYASSYDKNPSDSFVGYAGILFGS